MRKFLKNAVDAENFWQLLTPVNISLFLFFTIPVLYWIISRRHLPPGPICLPFFGHFHVISSGNFLYRKLMLLKKKYGNIFCVTVGGQETVVVCGHDLIREGLVVKGDKCKFRPSLYGIKKNALDKGLTWSNQKTWRKMRSVAERASKTLVKDGHNIDDVIHEEIQHLAHDLFIKKSGCPVDLREPLTKAVVSILFSFVMGKRCEHDSYEDREILLSLQELCKITPFKLPETYIPFARYFAVSKQAHSLESCMVKVREKFQKYFNRCKDTFSSKNIRHLADVYHVSVLESQETESPTDDEFVQVMVDMFMMGVEPTVATLLWTFLYMVRYPEVQSMCGQDMKKVTTKTKDITWKDRSNVPFVMATINEVHRIANVLPLGIPHMISEDMDLGGYTITKGTAILFHQYSSHMDHTYWKRPQEFRPEHFLDSNSRFLTHDTFFPYGLGSRSCPFSLLVDKIIFAFFTSLLRRFKFTVPEDTPAPSLEAMDDMCRSPRTYSVLVQPLE